MIKIPQNIADKMDLWRIGAAPFPQEYADFHEKQAWLDILKRHDWVPVRKALVDDGWGDEMKVLQIEIIVQDTPSYHREVLKWHESGAWFRKEQGGGWSRAYEMLSQDGHGATPSSMTEEG